MSMGGGAGVTAEQKFKALKYERITSDEGSARPIVFGRPRGIVGQLMWRSKIRLEWQYAGDVEVGKESEETYEQVPFRDFAIGICEAEGNVSLSKVWRNNKLVYDATRPSWAQNARFMNKTRFYNGSYSQLPDPTMEARLGAGNVPAFRGTAYMVRRNANLQAHAGAIPQFIFEVDATYAPPAPSGSADLQMTVEAVPDEVMVSDTITVTYTVENLGVDDSESAIVNFTSSPELSIVSSSLSKGSLAGGVWTIGDIANGTSETAEIVYEAIDDGIITVGATVSAATPDPDLLNNYDFHTVEIALGYDLDAQAIFDMLATPISAPEEEKLSNAIKMLKGENALSRSVWGLFDFLPFGMQGAPTQELSLIDWKQKRRMTPHGNVSWTRAGGWKGDGVTGSYIATGFIPLNHASAFTRNNASFGIRYTFRSDAALQRDLVSCPGNAMGLRVPVTTYQRLSGRVTGASEAVAPISDIPAAGDIYYYNRNNAANIQQMKNGAQVVSGNSTSVAITNGEMVLLASNSGNSASPDAEGLAWAGGYLALEDYQVLKAAHDFYIS